MGDQANPEKRARDLNSEQAFPLGELITALTKELRDAQTRAQQDAVKAMQMGRSAPKSLQVNGADIELAVQFERSGKGGLSFKVFGVGGEAGGSLARANTTTMTVHLGTEADEPWLVGQADEDTMG